MEGWKIAIIGTNKKIIPDENSEVDLDALIPDGFIGPINPMEGIPWTQLYITGMGAKKLMSEDDGERPGGISVHNRNQKQIYDIEVYDGVDSNLKFPRDMAFIESVMRVFRNRSVFMYYGTYDFPDDNFHLTTAPGRAIKIAAVATVEDDYDNGTKKLTISVKKVFPVVS